MGPNGVKEQIGVYTALMLTGAGIVLVTMFMRENKEWPSGSISSRSTPLAVPTLDPGPHAMYIVTMTPNASQTPAPTASPWPTPTVPAVCLPGLATPGAVCIVPYSTKIPTQQTPTSQYPGKDKATPGVSYIWPR